MSKTFTEMIRNGKIKQPTQRGFTEDSWKKSFDKHGTVQPEESVLFHAGIIIDGQLSAIRNELSKLYQRAPNLSNIELRRLYCSVSNRDRSILSSQVKGKIDETYISKKNPVFQNISSWKFDNNPYGNKLTGEEISTMCVDGYRKALALNIKNAKDPVPTKDPLDPILFIQMEVALSQLYEIYEGLWSGFLWGELTLVDLPKINVHCFKQICDNAQAIKMVSYQRKSRLAAESIAYLNAESLKPIISKCNSKKALKTVGTGKNKKFIVLKVSKFNEDIQHHNSTFIYQILALNESIPIKLLTTIPDSYSFSAIEVTEVFRVLALLCYQIADSFPSEDSAFSINKLKLFSTVLNKTKLTKAVSTATDMPLLKTNEIIEFLTFNGDNLRDLWCHPLIEIGPNKILPLITPLMDSIPLRLVEHWLVVMGIDVASKGFEFEDHIKSEINTAISHNKVIKDYDIGKISNFSINGTKEEIDLILRIGKTVIVGEVKCIVSVDSPISYYRTLKILEKASGQAIRKTEFVKVNLNAIFDKLGWAFDRESKYSVHPIVVNSNQMCSGISLFNVPICDNKILRILSEIKDLTSWRDQIVPFSVKICLFNR